MKFKFNKVDKHEFHEKFAWKPTKVSDESDKNTVVVFEKYMRRMSREYDNPRKGQRIHWEQYSKKEYFKKKLKGDFDKEEIEYIHATMTHDGTDMRVSASSTQSVGRAQRTSKPTVGFTTDSNTGIHHQ